MAIAIDPKKTWRYVLQRDRELPEEHQTKWILRRLPFRKRNEILDSASNGQRLVAHAADVCRWGIEGIDDDFPLRRADGSAVPFEREKVAGNGVCSETMLAMLSPADIGELAREIIDDGVGAGDLEKREPSPEVS